MINMLSMATYSQEEIAKSLPLLLFFLKGAPNFLAFARTK